MGVGRARATVHVRSEDYVWELVTLFHLAIGVPRQSLLTDFLLPSRILK